MPLDGEFPVEHNVAVEERAHGIDQRILLVIAFHQNCVKRRNAPVSEMPCALDQPREERKHGGRISLRRRRLTGCKADFALRHCEAGQRINDQKNVFAEAAKIFRTAVAVSAARMRSKGD